MSSSIDLAILKCLVGLSLAASSTLGAMLPRVARRMDPLRCQLWLPYANSLSAGLLLGAGVLHFFTGATATLVASSDVKGCGEAAEHILPRTSLALLCGCLASLFIDRVLLSGFETSLGYEVHGHSHDISTFLPKSPHEHTAYESVHSEVSSEESNREAHQQWTATIIIGTLLAFHAALEGLSVGLETSVQALRRGFLPLAAHKFFDGLLLGIQATPSAHRSSETAARKRRDVSLDEITPAPLPPAAHRSFTEVLRVELRFFFSVFAWSCVTPCVILLVVVMSATDASAPQHTQHESPMGPLAQSFGAGTFLYVALMGVLPSEFPSRGRAIGNPALKLFAVVIGLALVSFIEAMHHHDHDHG